MNPYLKFEIGHVLFIDIVGYSKLFINEQSEQIQKLKQIARGTKQFRLAEAEGKVLRLPTGDGGALVFRTGPEAPICGGLKVTEAHQKLRVQNERLDVGCRAGFHAARTIALAI